MARKGQSFEDIGKNTKSENPFSGCPKSIFKSVEEEKDYLKAQVSVIQIFTGRTDFEDCTV
ncbi:hypothetical protein [Bacillus stratosphericus]|uniref:hypothetical protein n=1 Tax=Bacillus stratosphericus TaxID=293386 RepID=UPI001CF93DAC|nr:hypothetical protein [Bacillus stratosphericus]